jgi:hypothetical protein
MRSFPQTGFVLVARLAKGEMRQGDALAAAFFERLLPATA